MVVLVLLSSALVVRLLFLLRFFTHGVFMLIFLVHPCLFLSGLLSLCLRSFFLFFFDVTSFARLVRILSRDRRCDNNHITSTHA